ncbi:MAG: lysylphosphatidylglycerol synthase transmembrane domain-containing protein, partial [bacterium]
MTREPKEPPLAPDFTARRLAGGILLGTGLAVCGIAIAIVGRGGREALHAASPPDFRFVAIAMLFAALDTWLGGYRLYHMARRLAPGVRPLDGLRADLANRCLAGITPFQTGGGPAQLYVLARVGLRVSAGVAIGTINFLVSTLVLIGFGVVALAFLPESLPGWLRVSTLSTLGVLVLLVVLGVLLLVKGRLPVTRGGGGRLARSVHRVLGVARRSLDIARKLLRAEPRAVLGLFPITIGLLAAKAVTTYFVFRAFAPRGHFEEMVGVLVIFILSLFFAPTPGATGVAEGAGTAFLVG